MTKSKWALDTTHSSVEFSIKHMMIAKVKGVFHEFSAEITADPTDLTTADIEFTINTASVDTRNNDRDNHLRGEDFFNVGKFPTLTFKATEIKKKDDDEYLVTGDVTLNGVTRQETFVAEYEGSGKDPWGNQKVGFEVEGKINRSDYGLTWNATLETGGVLVSDEVKISLDLQAVYER